MKKAGHSRSQKLHMAPCCCRVHVGSAHVQLGRCASKARALLPVHQGRRIKGKAKIAASRPRPPIWSQQEFAPKSALCLAPAWSARREQTDQHPASHGFAAAGSQPRVDWRL